MVFSKEKLKAKIQAEPVAKNHTLLLVDDEEANLRALQQLLESDYHILTAGNGQEALEVVQNNQNISLIISDQRMPKLTGVAFLQQTIALIPEAIRFILTGFTDIDAIIGAINDGRVYKYLTKPIEPKDLKITVKRALEAYELGQKNKKLVEELRELNASLEEKVELRTHKLQEAYQELERLSVTDELTRLYNRRYIMQKLDGEISRFKRYQREFAIAMFDVDYFKRINDNYGHQKGDEVLYEVADSIKNTIRITDEVGRYGGEEFLLLLPETNIEGGRTICERIRKNIETEVSDTVGLSITISGGMAVYHPEEDGSALLRRADELLYKAKENGRNRIEC